MNARTRLILKVAAALLVVMVVVGWLLKPSSPSMPRPYEGFDQEWDSGYEQEWDQGHDEEWDSGYGAEWDAEQDEGSVYDDDEYDEEVEDIDEEAEITRPLATSAALLPKPTPKAADFAKYAPKNLGAQNFLNASQFIGLNTQGSSLKNANYDLRASPVIPKRTVGPWAMSSIEPDVYQKPVF